jgi:hypothetical protein
MCVIAGLAILSIAAQAFLFDGQITIDRALNSPTLTVRYTNASAALVELRVNGESVATRSVDAGKNNGETTFNLNLATLMAGDNRIEIRLFDKAGKLLASENSTVTNEAQTQGPIFLTAPKMGATLQGKIDIKVGFGRDLKNSYVSFFIDNQFKSISNVPPFEFNWDTTKDSNGWHEIEAWVVDDSSSTYKTRKIRVFVQNVGGRTERVFAPEVKPPTTNTAPPIAKPPVAKVVANPAPKMLAEPMANNLHVGVSGATNTKPAGTTHSVATGPKEMLPTGKRLAAGALALQTPHTRQLPNTALSGVKAGAETGRVSIVKGQRLPNLGTFVIVYNTQFVNFDVQPRISNDGVPLTPLRYLLEKAGGKVDWSNSLKDVSAKADGRDIWLHIGDSFAKIDSKRIELEYPSFIDSGRTIVPLSFMRDALNVNIDYDKATGHVLITSIKK